MGRALGCSRFGVWNRLTLIDFQPSTLSAASRTVRALCRTVQFRLTCYRTTAVFSINQATDICERHHSHGGGAGAISALTSGVPVCSSTSAETALFRTVNSEKGSCCKSLDERNESQEQAPCRSNARADQRGEKNTGQRRQLRHTATHREASLLSNSHEIRGCEDRQWQPVPAITPQRATSVRSTLLRGNWRLQFGMKVETRRPTLRLRRGWSPVVFGFRSRDSTPSIGQASRPRSARRTFACHDRRRPGPY